ncbi:hypothetical protein B0U03_00725 [Listeria monocytogenes]|nr:hypothetical protein [Listeria monocytogenes]EAE0202044.1 hypothetical protein [Listeria monocytogenes]EAE9688515.1 hypothetical protein [Listeria monocytogenes]EAE9691343.1 hypothetical protein [Listeria monocytogenes]EAE9693818.1 hypothetical protein [Listeria monocytogenes]
MNELLFIKENFNVVSISFMRNGEIQKKLYDWYLPYDYLGKIHLHTKATITINGWKKKVFIANLSYHPKAKMLYKPFPLVPSQQPSWQIQLICQLMNYYGIKYDRERMFKDLTTIENRPLRVDVAFQKSNQWHIIEYHGTHHYFKRGCSTKRFQNILRNMEIKRQWCRKNNVRYLEIPFFRQNDIQEMVETFLETPFPEEV